jgi:dephospho-CoA kinase
MLKIGLTGGIGCGKTTVADLFAARGVPVLDADRVARELVEPGKSAFDAIVRRFGTDVLRGGHLDRSRLRAIVFADAEARNWLESLLHPLVYRELERRIGNLSAPYCLLVIPLLLETGHRDFVDRLLVVDCPEDVQRRRVARRDGLGGPEIERIMASQASRAERLAAADEVMDNTASREDLAARVERLHRHYLDLAGGPGTAID